MHTRGAETMLYIGGPTNTNKCFCQSGGGDQYMGSPTDFKVGGYVPPIAAPLIHTYMYIQHVITFRLD